MFRAAGAGWERVVGVAAIRVAVAAVGGLRVVGVLLAGARGAGRGAPRAAAAHQVLHVPVRGARALGAGRHALPDEAQPRYVHKHYTFRDLSVLHTDWLTSLSCNSFNVLKLL